MSRAGACAHPTLPILVAVVLGLTGSAHARGFGPASASPPPTAERLEAYEANRPKSVVELQPYHETATGVAPGGGEGAGALRSTLVNLHPGVNVWFLLSFDGAGAPAGGPFHLESVDAAQSVGLHPDEPGRLELRWREGGASCPVLAELELARSSGRSYAPICQGRLFLRNPTVGHKTNLEWTTDFLRDHVPGGDRITTLVRQIWFQDAYLETSEVFATDGGLPRVSGAPARPLVDPRYEAHALATPELGLGLAVGEPGRLEAGRWAPLAGVPGVFLSVIRPNLVAQEVVDGQRGRVSPLDEVEASALVYLVAFDLARFDLRFALGTDHPRVGWSDRVQPGVRDERLPGPDGIGSPAPLVTTGMVSPRERGRVVATFTGGFKRLHGGFRSGEFAQRNRGSHYGFVEQGVVLSKLQPGLATLAVWRDGEVDLGTWPDADPARLFELRYARQNGVPILDWDAGTRTARPGSLVRQWGAGNWSGSQDNRFRTLRSGLCLQEEDGQSFLVYGYFSSATPSAMAQVFQAYHCRYAMLLDMNALEHTYLAVYSVDDQGFAVQHLIVGMNVLDKSAQGRPVPRFLGYADNRDFFYLLRRLP